jgi:hypothetical protein
MSIAEAGRLVRSNATVVPLDRSAFAVQAEDAASWHVLDRREWVALCHAAAENDYAAAAAAATRSLHASAGVGDGLQAFEDAPSALVRAVCALNPNLRGRRDELVPVSTTEIARAVDCGLARGLLVRVPNAPAGTALEPRDCATAMVTADRPSAVDRMLGTLADQQARLGDPVVWRVVDNSANPRNAAETQDACRRASRPGFTVEYVGAEVLAAIERVLVAEGCDPHDVSFAVRGVRGPRVGAAKNIAMLLSRGRRLLVLDDDLIPDVWMPGSARRGCLLTDEADPRSFGFAATERELYRHLVRRPQAIWTAHCRPLGRRVNEIVRAEGLIGIDAFAGRSSWARLLSTGEARVRVTIHGVLGHGGMGWHRRLLTLRGAARDGLVQHQRIYEDVCRTGRMRRVSDCIQLSRTGTGSIGGMGIDTTHPTPPFMPSHRGEDVLFLDTLRELDRNAVLAYLPEVIEHWPIDDRLYDPHEFAMHTGLHVFQVVMRALAAGARNAAHREPGRCLRVLGESALSAARNESCFRRMAQDLWVDHVDDLLAATDQALQEHGEAPAWWAEDVRRLRSRLIAEAEEPASPLARDTGSADSEAAWRYLQTYVSACGRLLKAWPDLERAAERCTDALSERVREGQVGDRTRNHSGSA